MATSDDEEIDYLRKCGDRVLDCAWTIQFNSVPNCHGVCSGRATWYIQAAFMGATGGEYRRNNSNNVGFFRWRFTVPANGNYNLHVNLPVDSNPSTTAEYVVSNANGSESVVLNQATNGLISLGTFPFKKTQTYDLILQQYQGAGTGTLIADSIKLDFVSYTP